MGYSQDDYKPSLSCSGEDVERSYTPVNGLELHPAQPAQPEGEVIDLMIKLYKDGKMSGFLANLKIGECDNRYPLQHDLWM